VHGLGIGRVLERLLDGELTEVCATGGDQRTKTYVVEQDPAAQSGMLARGWCVEQLREEVCCAGDERRIGQVHEERREQIQRRPAGGQRHRSQQCRVPQQHEGQTARGQVRQ